MYKLNVDVAVRELERESLKGIMEFIWEQVDQDEIRKKEGDRLAELVKQKKDTHNDVSQFRQWSHYSKLVVAVQLWHICQPDYMLCTYVRIYCIFIYHLLLWQLPPVSCQVRAPIDLC